MHNSSSVQLPVLDSFDYNPLFISLQKVNLSILSREKEIESGSVDPKSADAFYNGIFDEIKQLSQVLQVQIDEIKDKPSMLKKLEQSIPDSFFEGRKKLNEQKKAMSNALNSCINLTFLISKTANRLHLICSDESGACATSEQMKYRGWLNKALTLYEEPMQSIQLLEKYYHAQVIKIFCAQYADLDALFERGFADVAQALEECSLRIKQNLHMVNDPRDISRFLSIAEQLLTRAFNNPALPEVTKRAFQALPNVISQNINWYESADGADVFHSMPISFFNQIDDINRTKGQNIVAMTKAYKMLLGKYTPNLKANSKLYMYLYTIELSQVRQELENIFIANKGAHKITPIEFNAYQSQFNKMQEVFTMTFEALNDVEDNKFAEISSNVGLDLIICLDDCSSYLEGLETRLSARLIAAHSEYSQKSSSTNQRLKEVAYASFYQQYIDIIQQNHNLRLTLLELRNKTLKQIWLECPYNLKELEDSIVNPFLEKIKQISADLKFNYNKLVDTQQIKVVDVYCQEALLNQKYAFKKWDDYKPKEKLPQAKQTSTPSAQLQSKTKAPVQGFTDEELEELDKPSSNKSKAKGKGGKGKPHYKNKPQPKSTNHHHSSTSSTSDVGEDELPISSASTNPSEAALGKALDAFSTRSLAEANIELTKAMNQASVAGEWYVVLRCLDARIKWYITEIKQNHDRCTSHPQLENMWRRYRMKKAKETVRAINNLRQHFLDSAVFIQQTTAEIEKLKAVELSWNAGKINKAVVILRKEIKELKDLIVTVSDYLANEKQLRKEGAEFMRLFNPDVYFNGDLVDSPYIDIKVASDNCVGVCSNAAANIIQLCAQYEVVIADIKSIDANECTSIQKKRFILVLKSLFDGKPDLVSKFQSISMLFNAAAADVLLSMSDPIYNTLLEKELCNVQGKMLDVISRYITQNVVQQNILSNGVKQLQYSYNEKALAGPTI